MVCCETLRSQALVHIDLKDWLGQHRQIIN
uniref:Uncharacterized protein n=1 Tax=Lepeophtheirus salmonis TaxID=72036 RepID=A0A0K2TKE9_LEPSM